MSDTSTADPLADAKQLCEKHGGLVIEEGTDNVYDKALSVWRYPPCWRVYRRLPGGRRTFLGKRSAPSALLRFVRKLI